MNRMLLMKHVGWGEVRTPTTTKVNACKMLGLLSHLNLRILNIIRGNLCVIGERILKAGLIFLR